MSNIKSLEIHRAKNQNDTLREMELVLDELRKCKCSYAYISDLAKYVAAQISIKRRKPLAYTTLNRNPVYRRELQRFMGYVDGNAEMSLSERRRLEGEIYDLKIQLGTALEETRRLRTYIAGNGLFDAVTNRLSDNSNEAPWKDKFKNLVLLTEALKRYFGEELEWSMDTNRVIDAALEREIISGEPVRVFNEYMNHVQKLHGN